MTASITHYPNTFQNPNAFVDDILQWLTKDEGLALWVVTRELLGWQKTTGPVSVSTIQRKTPITRKGVIDALKGLCEMGIMQATGRPTSDGQQYILTALIAPSRIKWDALRLRKENKKKKGKKRMAKALEAHPRNSTPVSETYQQSVSHTNQIKNVKSIEVVSSAYRYVVSETYRRWLVGLTDQTHINPINQKDSPALPAPTPTAEQKPKPPTPAKTKATGKPPKPAYWGDFLVEVRDAFNEPMGVSTKIAEQMLGVSPKGERKTHNCSPAAQLGQAKGFVSWYKKQHPDIDLPRSAEALSSWWHKYIQAGAPSAKSCQKRYIGFDSEEEVQAAYERTVALYDTGPNPDALAAYRAIMNGEDVA